MAGVWAKTLVYVHDAAANRWVLRHDCCRVETHDVDGTAALAVFLRPAGVTNEAASAVYRIVRRHFSGSQYSVVDGDGATIKVDLRVPT